ncbi:MAG: CDP-alcohol phosphatidyltransferase family protein [Nitrospinae bacterium]|nr:CDP-alcohol phosphatidyltransferase family protein [Nitrospinota bacterium]
MCGVLILVSPADGSEVRDWYLRKIVGVPFLLLNVLNLHKGGIERVVIYHPELSSAQGNPLTPLTEDVRVQGAVEWVSEAETLDRIVQEDSCRLVVNGAALHDKADIAAVLDGSLAPERARVMGCFETSPGAVRQVMDHFEKAVDAAAEPVLNPGSAESLGHRLTVVTGSPDTQVRRAEDFKVQRERLLPRGGMANDSFMDRWVSRHFSRQFTRLLIDTPVTPNQITWMHLVLGVGSAWFFYQGTYAMVTAGAVLLMISAWLDSTDGEVARLRFQQSRFGMILDIIGDNMVHWAVFLGIGWGVARATGNDIYILCGLLSVVGAVISFWLLQASVFKKRGGGEYNSSGWEDELANRDFLYFLFVMALIDQLNIFIAITAVGSNVFAGYVFYKKMKAA